MKSLILSLILSTISLPIYAKEHAIMGGQYLIDIPDEYVVKIAPKSENATVVVARSGRNSLSGINIVIYHAKVADDEDFKKNADGYFLSLKKGLKNFKEPKDLKGVIPRYKASGTIPYKGVAYSMDAYAVRYDNIVFYNLLYLGDEDKKLLDAVMSTFQQKKQ